jgi:hypothetical protein
MATTIGFVIVTHSDPPQTLRLIRTLQRIYDNPPIVWHHDFDQTTFSQNEIPSGVRLVLPHLRTQWGHFSVVMAFLRGLELLYSDDNAPDWFVMLSGADYPTIKAETVLRELAMNGMDALIDLREVPFDPHHQQAEQSDNPALQNFSLPFSATIAKRRYVDFNAWLPVVRRGPRLGKRIIFLPFRSFMSPFGLDLKCFYGDHWFIGSRKIAEILTNPSDQHKQLGRYLRWRSVPEECYYHTVLGNIPGLKMTTDTRRFAKWQEGSAHPEILGSEDLPAIIASKAYFSRKFASDSPVLDEIDRTLA